MTTKIIKLTQEPLTYYELYLVAQLEGDFEENFKLAEEVRANHFVLEK